MGVIIVLLSIVLLVKSIQNKTSCKTSCTNSSFDKSSYFLIGFFSSFSFLRPSTLFGHHQCLIFIVCIFFILRYLLWFWSNCYTFFVFLSICISNKFPYLTRTIQPQNKNRVFCLFYTCFGRFFGIF